MTPPFALSSAHARLLSAAVLMACASGCVYRTPAVHVPEGMPALSPVAPDSPDVTVVKAEGELTPETERAVRRETAEILAKATREQGKSGAFSRVHVRVNLEDRRDIYDAMREDGIAVIALLYAPFGVAMEREKLSVEVTVESGGRTFTGQGAANKLGGLYAPARRRALSVALDLALADASRRGSVATEGERR